MRGVIGDIHLSGFESDTCDENGLPFRLGLIIKTLNFIVRELKSGGIYEVDILGDLINDKSVIYTVAQNAFKSFLDQNKDIKFRIISGNHDMSSTGELRESAITVFDTYSNVECIPYDPKVIGNITYVPFESNFLDTLKNIEPNDILISHLGLSEAMLQSGLSIVDKVTLRDLASKFKLAILGHYHKPQHISGNGIEVYFPGNITHSNWNDKNEQKMFLIYDPDTLKVEQFPITGFREFKEFVISDASEKDSMLQLAEIAKNQGHVVRIRNTTGEKLLEDSNISEDILLIETEDVDITDRGIEISQTREEQLKNYLRIKGIDPEYHNRYLDVLARYNILTDNVGEE